MPLKKKKNPKLYQNEVSIYYWIAVSKLDLRELVVILHVEL